jgi:hypothetical protein
MMERAMKLIKARATSKQKCTTTPGNESGKRYKRPRRVILANQRNDGLGSN